MTNQGLYGALVQYWNIEEKPRLTRKNTYFNDVQVSNAQALRVGIVVGVIAMAMALFLGIGGVFV